MSSKKLTDWDATHGIYKALSCEWTLEEKPEKGYNFIKEYKLCNKPVIYGKAYCEEHLKMAYRTVDIKVAETEHDQLANEIKEEDIPLIVVVDDNVDIDNDFLGEDKNEF